MSDLESARTTRIRAHVPGPAGPSVASVLIGMLGLGLIVVLFFAWNTECLSVRGQVLCSPAFGVVSGWAGFGVAAGLAAGCLVLWEALSAAGALILADQATEPVVAAGLGLAAVVCALLRVLTRLAAITQFAWLGLALSACLFAVAALRLLGCVLARGHPDGRVGWLIR